MRQAMLSARAYSFHQKSKLAISLSWIGGYTNVVTLLSCGWVSAHVTGPTIWFGRVLVEREGPVGASERSAFLFGFVIVAFFLGAALSAVMTETAERLGKASKFVKPMAVEATLLSLFAIGAIFPVVGGTSAGEVARGDSRRHADHAAG